MGIGCGYAISAALNNPSKKIICIQGDSAFGFSAMDIETAARYKLNIIFVILNNHGIYSGIGEEDFKNLSVLDLPGTIYFPNSKYEKIAECFGGKGYFITEMMHLKKVVRDLKNASGIIVVNVMIDPNTIRKDQWLTRKSKL